MYYMYTISLINLKRMFMKVSDCHLEAGYHFDVY